MKIVEMNTTAHGRTEDNSFPTISVIVPVYKVEKYLPMCIESILAQTYSDIELILVDDGSPDNCPAICDYYAEKDSRVKVIHKPNGGVSCARNTGLKNAVGCFVMFVDSDDYIAPTMLQEMLSRMDDDIDGVFSGLKYVFPDSSKNKVYSLPDAIVHMPEELDQYYQSLLSAFGNFTSCAKLYRRSTLLTNNVYFEEKIALLEDATFVSCFLRHCRKCRFMSEAFYTYRQLDEESLVKRFHPNANEALVIYYLNSLWMQDHLSPKSWRRFKDIIDMYQVQFVTQIYDCSRLSSKEKLSTLKKFAKTFREHRLCAKMGKYSFMHFVCSVCLNGGLDVILHCILNARKFFKKVIKKT